MITYLIILVLVVLLEVFIILLFEQRDNKYCNSNYLPNNSLKLPKYKIIKIEKTYNKNYTQELAKYTIRTMYAVSSNNVKEQTLILYDEINKYNIGDILVFKNCNG